MCKYYRSVIVRAMPDSLSSDVLRNAIALIDACAVERVLFVGEAIEDEYRFVEPLGRPSKEAIIAGRVLRSETYSGGVAAAYRHATNFCQAAFTHQTGILRKARYLTEDGRKLFEAQELDAVTPWSGILGGHDHLAVTDFGHGFLPAGAPLLGRGLYLAIACQTNAANAGFNLITKYPAADYIVIDEPEARLAAGDRDSPIEDVMRRLAHGRCPRFVVTHGRHGAYALECGEFYSLPAMSDRVVDTMGAGDAFFAVTACMARLSPEFGGLRTLLAIGNAAGAVKCGILGHRAAVTKAAVIERLKAAA